MNESRLHKKTKGEDFLIEALDLLRLCIVCLVFVYAFITFLIKPVRVDGPSMYPTLEDKEMGGSNVFSRLAFGVKRFDVVVVKEPESGDLWVKRVIGLPGETVEYKEGKLYIDGKYYEENFFDDEYVNQTAGSRAKFTGNFKSEKLKDDEYFLMGDNRPHSRDSRARGPFKASEIVCKDVYVLYPFDKIKVVR